MPKTKYFDLLEKASTLCSRAVSIYCSPPKSHSLSELASIAHELSDTVCLIEYALFSDFMPPLDRSSIARCVHSLSRVTACCLDRQTESYTSDSLCISLAKAIEKEVYRLREIKKEDSLPDLTGVRKIILDLQPRVSKKGERHLLLRQELYACFDSVIEVMLTNI